MQRPYKIIQVFKKGYVWIQQGNYDKTSPSIAYSHIIHATNLVNCRVWSNDTSLQACSIMGEEYPMQFIDVLFLKFKTS